MMLLGITTFLAFIALLIQAATGLSLLDPTNVTTPNLVRKAGYPLEEHQVTTKDGYILTIHRIPHSPRQLNRRHRRRWRHQQHQRPSLVTFLQHGILGSSVDWIGLGPSTALGYLLSDNGYDVWIGNSRGNRYSEKHIKKDPSSSEFWDFSWHEMGVYDLPAVFDYITNETGVARLTYIGYSQGATEFLVYCSIDPSCKEKIISAHLLAPVTFTKHMITPIVSILASMVGQANMLEAIFGNFNIAPSTELFQLLGQLICYDYSNLKFVCADFLYDNVGPSNYLNESMIPFLFGVYPAGSSLKQFMHYAQEYNSGKFRPYDNGPMMNLWKYGSLTPPDYNLGNVRVPIHLYYSENDFIATPNDIAHLAKVLPKGVVRSIYKVPPKKWNHIDFLFGMNVRRFLYHKILTNIRKSILFQAHKG